MIWRAAAADGTYLAKVGINWQFGCCPRCAERDKLLATLKRAGYMIRKKDSRKFALFKCCHCEWIYIFNYVTQQLADACSIHYQPVPVNACALCISDSFKEARKQIENSENYSG